MSGSVRARRPASPPLGLSQAPPASTSQRFPHPREAHLDADARKASASKAFTPSRKSHPPGGLKLTSGEWKLLAGITFIACAVRLFRLAKPNSVVFDEVHFGKFASKYIKTQYFVDVHPPLAKLLITLAAFIFGYDGHFDFKDIGKIYEQVPYVAMRMVPATFGIATVPLAYLTLRALDCRATTALLASLFVTFENGMITQSRHILLDSPLIFFTALTIFLWVGFCNEDKYEPFSDSWWAWLLLSGLSLGAVVSCKWVGLFTIATVGLSTIYQLWVLLGDIRLPPRVFMRHFMARALCLILVPILFYMTMFQIHFMILGSSGDGDGFMSSEFQQTLGGRHMDDTYADVALGSKVTLRHVNTQGGYLHSHSHNYPGGSKQQQITLYPHRDSNNDWLIINATTWNPLDGIPPLTYVEPGMRIRLRHSATEKSLHSHDIRPPVSDVEFQNEVSGYGMAGFAGDANDDWTVEIEYGDKRDKESTKRLRTLRTKFRLRHVLTGCYLFSHKVKLPEWGYEQQEVTCNKNAPRPNSLWYIETSSHTALPPDAPKVNYKLPGFVSKFLELQAVMWKTNAGLTDRHTYDSRPDSWPWLRRGINFWVKDHRQIYLIGNPMIWWLSSLAVVGYALVRGFLIFRAKRGYRDFDSTKVVRYDGLCGFFFIGWCLHYFPFWLMGRQLFLHHYFPALYFAILLLCAVFDLITATLRPRIRLQITVFLIIVAIWNFVYFSPLAYGNSWTKEKCGKAKWLKTWDFSCNDFFDDYSFYAAKVPATPTTSIVPVSTIGGEAGGRAPIVVEDKGRLQMEKLPQEKQTSVGGIKAEPGPDVFAVDPARDVQSQARPPDQPPKAKENPKSALTTDSKVATTVQVATEKSSVSSSNSQASLGEQSSNSVAADSTQPTKAASSDAATTEDDSARHKPAGPLPEDELEADRAAEELFPGAV